MKNNEMRIKEAFNSILMDDYTQEDVEIIKEHADDIFTFENTIDCADTLSAGRNGYGIFSALAKYDRQQAVTTDQMCFYFEGTLLDLLNAEAESMDLELPEELKKSPSYTVIDSKFLCDKDGNLYPVAQDQYVLQGSISAEDVENAKEEKRDIEVKAFDLEDGEEKWIVYPYEKAEINFDDYLDYDANFTVEK